jgi:hypothetical protein
MSDFYIAELNQNAEPFDVMMLDLDEVQVGGDRSRKACAGRESNQKIISSWPMSTKRFSGLSSS